MSLAYSLVDGRDSAAQASELLTCAWPLPTLQYSAPYLAWQLSFPGPHTPRAVAAFDEGRMVGFAGATPRRIWNGEAFYDAWMISFVAVHPDMRKHGVAGRLYELLLAELQALGGPIITFAIRGSGGQRAIEKAYPAAGYRLYATGSYPVYGCLARAVPDGADWETAGGNTDSILAAIYNHPSSVPLIRSAPTAGQTSHYLTDPRPRTLLVLRSSGAMIEGAAWAVRVDFLGVSGKAVVPTIECIWLDRRKPEVLPALAAATARLWPEDRSANPVVQAPNLAGFNVAALRHLGFRHVGVQYEGYLAVSGEALSPAGLGIEIT
jgi:GNAT superfamily N-acetyltransferase